MDENTILTLGYVIFFVIVVLILVIFYIINPKTIPPKRGHYVLKAYNKRGESKAKGLSFTDCVDSGGYFKSAEENFKSWSGRNLSPSEYIDYFTQCICVSCIEPSSFQEYEYIWQAFCANVPYQYQVKNTIRADSTDWRNTLMQCHLYGPHQAPQTQSATVTGLKPGAITDPLAHDLNKCISFPAQTHLAEK